MYHFHYISLLVLLLFTLFGYIHSLDPSCLRLSESQECQAFQDYAINVSSTAATVAVPWIRNSTSVDELDKHLRSYVMQQQWWWQGNNSIRNSSVTDPLCGSNGDAVFSARYSKTILCAQMVRTSPGCNNNFNSTLPLPALCNTTCAGFVNSITSCYIANATLIGQQCPSSSNEITCTNGYDNEKLCGWTGDDGKGCTYCQAEPNDSCCATLHEAGTCSSLTTQQIVSAILGSVFGCFFLLGCVWFCCWCNHRYRYHSPSWPFSRPFFSKIRKKIGPSTSTSISPTSQQQRNVLSPQLVPAKNDDSHTLVGMTRKSAIDSDMKQMDNMINMYSTNTTTSAKDEGSTSPSLPTTTLSYTLAERHTTGYCFYQAIYVNVPTRPDDIMLNKGDIVYLHCYTNEDWGIGYNIVTGQQGSFPMICICSLPLNQVWEWVNTHPMIKHRSLLKHRVSYFISAQHDDDDDAEADDEQDIMMTTTETTTAITTKKMKTKRPPTALTRRLTIVAPSSDDEDSPLTPPPPTLLHRAFGKKGKSLGRSKRLWIGGGSSSFSSLQQQEQQQCQKHKQLYYQPLDSTLTLGYPTPLD